MRASLVIPTLNAAKELPALLETVQAQTVELEEVLVVDSSSKDGTSDVAKRFGARTLSIPRSEFDHGGTRHAALMETSGDFVLFMTQDALPVDRFYIERLLEPFSDSEVAMVSGRQLPKPDARRFEQLVREFNYPAESNVRSIEDVPELGMKAFFASDVCSAYRRNAYLECGGFERPCNIYEDLLMAATFLREGWKVAYAADAQVLHSHNLAPVEQYRRNREGGIALARNEDLLRGASSTGEGARLAKAVASRLLREGELVELAAFGIDCCARLLGDRAGRKSAKPHQGGRSCAKRAPIDSAARQLESEGESL